MVSRCAKCSVVILSHMEQYPERLNSIFQALADPTRRAVLGRLSRGPASISELAKPFDMALPSFMKHIRSLEDSGWILTQGWPCADMRHREEGVCDGGRVAVRTTRSVGSAFRSLGFIAGRP